MESIHIVGSGPAGLMAAQQYALKGHPVIVYDHKSAPARKFLVAGNGGFNLTHSEELELFLSRYDSSEIRSIVCKFTNRDTVDWLQSIGIPVYTGSSGKVFPIKGIKPIEVLQKWLVALDELGVKFCFNHRLIDFDTDKLIFTSNKDVIEVPYKRAIFAFGGKSWSKTGSDGVWVPLFESKSISVTPLQSSNSGLEMQEPFVELAGKPLKNIRLFNNVAEKYGELVFTNYGIEGSAVYFMNRYIRDQPFPQNIYIDLKPTLQYEEVFKLLDSGKTIEVLKNKLKLDKVKLSLLKTLDKASYTNPKALAENIKKFTIKVENTRPIDEVISTFGGVHWKELNVNLCLKKFPNIQCCGEMLDWDAPTGGYLLQACFASGYFTAIDR